ncbi:MAG TPA: DUF4956 domain-containing protein [Vicinamibacterales bacterium]|nr:DUF4956 domain-containing protein [Vicinamibacterales bacterium]
MPDFLKSVASEQQLPLVTIVIRLVAAAILGGAVAGVYRITRPGSTVTQAFLRTLVLLSILIAMVTQVIGDNIALAFSLVGALSIVRFRTVVRDTEDTAFVIFAVATGMAAGASKPGLALAGLVVVTITAIVMRSRPARTPDALAWFQLSVRVGLGHDAEALIGGTIDKFVSDRRVMSMATARQGMSIDITYETRLRKDSVPDDLVKALNRIEGIQSVELQRRAEVDG